MTPALPFKLRSDLTITSAITADSRSDVYMIKQPSSGEIFELGKEEFFLAQCLDGYTSLADVIQRFDLEFGLSITEEYLKQFIKQIGEFGLLEPLRPSSPAGETARALNHNANNAANNAASNASNNVSNNVSTAASGVPTAVAVRAEMQSSVDAILTPEMATNALPEPENHGDGAILTAEKRRSDRWYWFNPTPLLRVIDILFSPLRPLMRVLVWLVFPAVLVGGAIFFENQDLLWQDIERLKSPGSYVGTLLFHLVTVNLASRLAIGTVCAHYGGEIKEFGLRLRFGLIPRFYIDASSANRFNRRAKLWTYGTALLLRIVLFLTGIFAWVIFRGSSTQLAVGAISMAQAGFIGLIIVSAPVRASYGYRWFTTLTHLPANLLQRAFIVFGATLRGRALPTTISFKSRLVLWVYALLLVICWILIAFKITTSIAGGLNSTFPDIFGRATPVLLVAGVAWLFIRWFWDAKLKGLVQNKDQNKDSNKRNEATGAATKGIATKGVSREGITAKRESANEHNGRHNQAQAMMVSSGTAGELEYPWESNYPRSARSIWLKLWIKRALWLLTLIGLVVFLTRPHPYRPGGAVQLLPPQQQQIQVPIGGQLTAVHFDGGDGQWIQAGTVVASMVATELQNDLAMLQEKIVEQQAEISKQQSALAKVNAGPRQEAVNVVTQQIAIAQEQLQEAQKQLEASEANRAIAQQKIETAQVQMPFRLAQLERFQRLHEEGAYTAQGVEEAQAQVDVTQEEIIETQKEFNYAVKQTETARQGLAIKQRELESAQAELTLLQSGALPEDVEAATQEVNAAEAHLRGLQQNLSHTQAQLQSTELVMPIDGYLVTPYLKQQLGSYFDQGSLFATVQNDQVAIAELELPEYDSGELTAGSAATVKLLAFPNTPIEGEIFAIEPTTSEELYGPILKLLIRIDNSDQRLKAGMTGYAKIEAGEKSLFVLLTRPIVRFVQIELWSWLP